MSKDDSMQSNSESSGSSCSNHLPFFEEHISKDPNDIADLTLYGSPAPTLARSGTVKRAGINFIHKKDKDSLSNSFSVSEDSDSVFVRDKPSPEHLVNNRYRRSLDCNLRRSLESISEHKTKRDISPTCTFSTTSRYSSSLESFSSDPENAIRSSTNTKNEEEKTVQSPASSYLSWIESVGNEFITTPAEARPVEVNDVDSKVGEWNNFWLNYNSARSRYMSSAFLSAEDRMGDDISETKSSINSTHKEPNDKPSEEHILLTLDEVHEALKCSKKLTEIFQSALIRNDHDCENSNLETSYYSEPLSRQNSSIKEDNASIFTSEDLKKVARERSASYIITTQDLLKQKELLKPTAQSSSTSCINAILNTGVADILKRVISKRRDIMTPDDMSSMTRRSFSEWSSK